MALSGQCAGTLNLRERLRQPGEHLVAVRGHDDEVLDPHPDVTGQVDARLDGYDVPGGERALGARGQARLPVDLKADPVPKPVAEVIPVPRLGDQRARGGVDILALGARRDGRGRLGLRALDEVVDLPGAAVDGAGGEGARA